MSKSPFHKELATVNALNPWRHATENPQAPITAPRVIVAFTTALLTFISLWRAAAIVLNDLASSAYYAGGESEGFIGKSAPWFILAVMVFSYCVRQIYMESCSIVSVCAAAFTAR